MVRQWPIRACVVVPFNVKASQPGFQAKRLCGRFSLPDASLIKSNAGAAGPKTPPPTKTASTFGGGLRSSYSDCTYGVPLLLPHVRRPVLEHMVGQGKHSWYSFKEPKSGHGRSVDLGAATTSRLREHRKAQAEMRLAVGTEWTDLDLVIATPTGQPIRPSTTSGRLRTVVGNANLSGVRFHDLRHAHATFLLKAGTPPHVVSKRLGHSTVAFTLQVYAHVLPGQQREAADAIEATLLGTAQNL